MVAARSGRVDQQLGQVIAMVSNADLPLDDLLRAYQGPAFRRKTSRPRAALQQEAQLSALGRGQFGRATSSLPCCHQIKMTTLCTR